MRLSRVALTVLVMIAGQIASADQGRVFSEIVHSGDQPLQIDVPSGKRATLERFVQTGGEVSAVVTFTRGGRSMAVFTATVPGDPGFPTGPRKIEEIYRRPIKELAIAGPASLTVAPVAEATIYLIYRIEKN